MPNPVDRSDLAITEEVFNRVLIESGERMLAYFKFGHLPGKLQIISSRFGLLAAFIVENIASSAERTVALRKLLESKDAAVRAAL